MQGRGAWVGKAEPLHARAHLETSPQRLPLRVCMPGRGQGSKSPVSTGQSLGDVALRHVEQLMPRDVPHFLTTTSCAMERQLGISL